MRAIPPRPRWSRALRLPASLLSPDSSWMRGGDGAPAVFRPRHPARALLFLFMLLIAVGTVLLALPVSGREGSVGWGVAWFTATSATCVTGLTVVDVFSTYSVFGQVVIMLLVQLGGLGYMLSSTLLFLLLGRDIGLRDRLLLRDTLGQVALRDTRRIMFRAVKFTLIIEGIGAAFLTWRFYQEADFEFGRALYYGVFHAITAFCNAGFDIMGVGPNGEFSLALFRGDPVVNLAITILIVFGGIGFAVSQEVWDRRGRGLSLLARLVLVMTALLIATGALVFSVAEWNNPNTLGSLPLHEKIWASWFHAVSWRTAGFSTLDVGGARSITLLIGGLLMFIGGAPGSTAGGVKITTFAVMIAAVAASIRGRVDVEMLGRRIAAADVFRALVLVLLAFGAIVAGTFVLAFTEPDALIAAGFRQNLFIQIQFEVISAVATVGLSTGITGSITEGGRIMIIGLMFLGRLGPTTLAAALEVSGKPPRRRLPETNVPLG